MNILFKTYLVVPVLLFLVAPPNSYAGLIGTEVTASRVYQGQHINVHNAVASEELLEFDYFSRFEVDIRDTSVRFDSISEHRYLGGDVPFWHYLELDFSLVDHLILIDVQEVNFGGITGVYPIGDPVGPFSDFRVRSVGSRLEIDVGGYQFAPGAFIEVELQTQTTIPEAGSVPLLALGLLLLRSRKRHRSVPCAGVQ